MDAFSIHELLLTENVRIGIRNRNDKTPQWKAYYRQILKSDIATLRRFRAKASQ